jgi:hypothetical protein
VEVVPIDQQNIHRRMLETAGAREAAKAGSGDQDPGSGARKLRGTEGPG